MGAMNTVPMGRSCLLRHLVVALMVLSLAACGPVMPTPSASPSTTPAVPANSPTAPRPSPTAVPSDAAWTHVTLTRVPSAAFGATKDDQIVASTTWPGGFLFLGETFAGAPPAEIVWRSADGSTWTRTAVSAFAGTDVRGITWTGQRLVVIAAVHPISGITALIPPLGFAWTSIDGTIWTPVADPDGALARMIPTSIGSGPAGVVIAGHSLTAGISLLHSPDGLTWTADDMTTPAFSRVQGGAVVGWAEGFLLAAGVPAVITPPIAWAPPSAAAFRSNDGINWVQSAVPPGAESLDFVTAGDQIVATGDVCVACPGAFASWSTADHGATWQQQPRPSQGLATGTMITSTGTRFVDVSAGRLRWSNDGRTWHPLVSIGPAISPDYFFDLLVSGDRVVLVGWQGIFPPDQPTGPTPLSLVGRLG